MVKNPPANVGDTGDTGSIPELGRFPGGGHGNHSSVLAWRIPRTEEPGGLQSMGLQRVRHDLGAQQQQQTDKGTKDLERLSHWHKGTKPGSQDLSPSSLRCWL